MGRARRDGARAVGQGLSAGALSDAARKRRFLLSGDQSVDPPQSRCSHIELAGLESRHYSSRAAQLMGRLATHARITRVTETGCRSGPDTVVVGEPLEIRVNGSPLAVTMHTPGSDIELTQGFLFTENIIRDRADIASIRYCNSVDADGSNTYNVLDVELAPLRRPGRPDDPVTFGCPAFGGILHPV